MPEVGGRCATTTCICDFPVRLSNIAVSVRPSVDPSTLNRDAIQCGETSNATPAVFVLYGMSAVSSVMFCLLSRMAPCIDELAALLWNRPAAARARDRVCAAMSLPVGALNLPFTFWHVMTMGSAAAFSCRQACILTWWVFVCIGFD